MTSGSVGKSLRDTNLGLDANWYTTPAEGSLRAIRGAILLCVRRAGIWCPRGGETTDVFVVDDLVGWLIGRLAEAGYQKLTTLVRGSPQERALKQAVKSAVQATADEISPTDKERAGQLAELISGAFGKPPPAKLLPRKLTRLEGLYAGTAQQLSVLDEGGQPPAGLWGWRSAWLRTA